MIHFRGFVGSRLHHGFTLIELLLVLVLLGVSSGFAVVSVNQLVSRWQERSMVSGILATLKMARVSAMSSGKVVSVEVQVQGVALATTGGGHAKTLALKAPYGLSTHDSSASRYLFWPDGSIESGTFSLVAGARVVHRFELNGVSDRIQ